jgi:hypothetical protein
MEQSRETIDHFLPRHRDAFPELALAWENLFPACDRCNSQYKKTRWSCRLVRPDTDPVEGYFDLDEATGQLHPVADLDWDTRVNVRLTICVFRLNDSHRCIGRLRVLNYLRTVSRAYQGEADAKDGEEVALAEFAAQGPYRFVARRFLKSKDGSS